MLPIRLAPAAQYMSPPSESAGKNINFTGCRGKEKTHTLVSGPQRITLEGSYAEWTPELEAIVEERLVTRT